MDRRRWANLCEEGPLAPEKGRLNTPDGRDRASLRCTPGQDSGPEHGARKPCRTSGTDHRASCAPRAAAVRPAASMRNSPSTGPPYLRDMPDPYEARVADDQQHTDLRPRRSLARRGGGAGAAAVHLPRKHTQGACELSGPVATSWARRVAHQSSSQAVPRRHQRPSPRLLPVFSPTDVTERQGCLVQMVGDRLRNQEGDGHAGFRGGRGRGPGAAAGAAARGSRSPGDGHDDEHGKTRTGETTGRGRRRDGRTGRDVRR